MTMADEIADTHKLLEFGQFATIFLNTRDAYALKESNLLWHKIFL